MRNITEWHPTKITRHGRRFRPNLSGTELQSYYICHTYLDLYVKYIQEYSRGRLLDCGCGQVPYYEVYKDLVEDVVCTDWPDSMHENKFVDVFSDLNEKLNFEDDSFDTVLLTDVLEHIFYPHILLAEIKRVLKKGGKVVIATPFIYRIHEEPHDYYRYTEYALRRLCKDAGLKVIRLEPYGRYFDVVFDTLNKVFIRHRFLLKPFLTFTWIVKKSFINRKINRAHQDKYALGYILCAEKPARA